MKKTLYLLGLVLFIASCSSDHVESEICFDPTSPECENYNPCLNVKKTSAEFDIKSKISLGGIYADSFAIGLDHFRGGSIKFSAIEDNAQYKWIIGAETLYTRTVTRNFSNVQKGAIIPIYLEVEKTPNIGCFPDDNGMDSLVKNINIITDVNQFNIVGKYKGRFGHKSDSTIINLGFSSDGFFVSDISQADTSLILEPELIDGYSSDLLIVLDGGGHLIPKGDIWLDPKTNILRMKYDHVKTPLNTTETIVFEGVKLE